MGTLQFHVFSSGSLMVFFVVDETLDGMCFFLQFLMFSCMCQSGIKRIRARERGSVSVLVASSQCADLSFRL